MDLSLPYSSGASAPGNGSPPTDPDDKDDDDDDKGKRSNGVNDKKYILSGVAIMGVVQGLIWTLVVTK